MSLDDLWKSNGNPIDDLRKLRDHLDKPVTLEYKRPNMDQLTATIGAEAIETGIKNALRIERLIYMRLYEDNQPASWIGRELIKHRRGQAIQRGQLHQLGVDAEELGQFSPFVHLDFDLSVEPAARSGLIPAHRGREIGLAHLLVLHEMLEIGK